MSDALENRWNNFCAGLDVADTQRRFTIWEVIRQNYSEDHRHYHTLDHIADCLEKLDWAKTALRESGDLAGLTDAEVDQVFNQVEMAIWFHDIIYNPKEKDVCDETRSAKVFQGAAFALGLPKEMRGAVKNLIMITKTHTKAATLAEKIMVDIDLSILGASPAQYDVFERNVRKEYQMYPDAIYARGRDGVLKTFEDQKPIYKTKAFQDRYEAQAKTNLARARQNLRTMRAGSTPGTKLR